MELTLNLGWILLAGCMFCLWLQYAPRSASDRRMQFVALAVLILVLLPAISMTDDLLAAQNPAEAVTSVRRDHDDSKLHPIVPIAAAPPVPILSAGMLCAAIAGLACEMVAQLVKSPALSSIQNRPPPLA
jgi:hypothetical protein